MALEHGTTVTIDPMQSPVRTVFVVEDDPESLRGLTRALTMQGYEVSAYSQFEQARHDLLASPPDALLLDVRLGPFNGLHLALLGRERCPRMKIVVFSGFLDSVLVHEAEGLDATFLEKPLDFDWIGDYLRRTSV